MSISEENLIIAANQVIQTARNEHLEAYAPIQKYTIGMKGIGKS